jgi:hypothetical protein
MTASLLLAGCNDPVLVLHTNDMDELREFTRECKALDTSPIAQSYYKLRKSHDDYWLGSCYVIEDRKGEIK